MRGISIHNLQECPECHASVPTLTDGNDTWIRPHAIGGREQTGIADKDCVAGGRNLTPKDAVEAAR